MKTLSVAAFVSLVAGSVLALGCAGRTTAPSAPTATVKPTGEVSVAQLARLHDRAEALLDDAAGKPSAEQTREALALGSECVRLADLAEQAQPGRVHAPYYRALCRSLALRAGGSVRRRPIEALKQARLIERDAVEAVRRDESYQQGGPLRLLGMFYVRAPRWPLGPGDLDKGTTLLQRARDRFPQEPLNRLFYAEALAAQGEDDAARQEAQAIHHADLAPRWRPLWERLRRI